RDLAQITVKLWEEDLTAAETLARDLLAAHPDDLRALQAMLQVLDRAERKDEARTLVQAHLRKDPANRALQRYAISLESDSAVRDEKLLAFINEIEDPFQRHSELAEYYRSKNDPTREQEYLDKAEALDPNSSNIIERQFTAALRAMDWARADRYVARFRKLDLDG